MTNVEIQDQLLEMYEELGEQSVVWRKVTDVTKLYTDGHNIALAMVKDIERQRIQIREYLSRLAENDKYDLF